MRYFNINILKSFLEINSIYVTIWGNIILIEKNVSTINSNMVTITYINITSDFASAFMVCQIGKIVSVDIDGTIIANARTIIATGLPRPVATTWIADLIGRHFRVYLNGDISCANELTEGSYVNLHFTYISV